MKIQNRFEVPMLPGEAWAYLMDIAATVPCFPGATLIEQLDADNYKGRVTVRLGPVSMVFDGKLRIEDRNDEAHSGSVEASWTESRGRGNAKSVTRFAMHEHEGGTRVELDTEVQLAGQVAQYGRGAGMIADISAQLVSRFADNLRARINEGTIEHGEIPGLTLATRALVNRIKGT